MRDHIERLVNILPFGFGSHQPKNFGLRAIFNGLLQKSLQGISGAVILLKVGSPQPDGLPLGKDCQRVGKDCSCTLVSSLTDARFGILHPDDDK